MSDSTCRSACLAATMALAAIAVTACSDAPPDEVVARPAAPAATPAPSSTPPTSAAPPTTPPASVTTPPAARPAPPATGTATPASSLTFEKLDHDFGTIWDISEQSTTFPFTNDGAATVVIDRIKTSCGCTAAELEKMEYAPGESSAIAVAFSPKGKGIQRKTIDVFANGSEEPIRLSIRSNVKPFVTIEPRIMRLDKVQLGETKRATFNVSSPDPNLQITKITANGRSGGERDLLSARIIDEPRERPGGTDQAAHIYTVEVTLADTAPWGQMYGSVTLDCRGTLPDGKVVDHTATCTVNATVFGELHVDQTLFRIGAVAPGKSFETVVRLKRTSGEPFAITRLEILKPTLAGTAVRAEPIPGIAGYRVLVSGDTGTYNGHLGGEVVIETDIPGEPEMRLRLAGLVREPVKR